MLPGPEAGGTEQLGHQPCHSQAVLCSMALRDTCDAILAFFSTHLRDRSAPLPAEGQPLVPPGGCPIRMHTALPIKTSLACWWGF
jgi:hypothetical protein